MVVAHRGLTVSAPENTLGSIRAAVAAGISLVEVDVRANRDGELFLLHDATLDRVCLKPVRLSALGSAETAKIRHADGSPLARLEEALDLLDGRLELCLDVKEAHTAGRLLDVIGSRREAVQVWSQHTEVVGVAAAAGLRSTLISSGYFPTGIGAFLAHARAAGATAVSFYPADLESHVAAACRKAAMPFLCGTPNDVPTWRYLLRKGVAAIITDRPLLLRRKMENGKWKMENGKWERVKSEDGIGLATLRLARELVDARAAAPSMRWSFTGGPSMRCPPDGAVAVRHTSCRVGRTDGHSEGRHQGVSGGA